MTITRSERRKAATRATLVSAAQRLLAEGREGVSIAEIAEAADVGTGTFYNHFSSRDALFEAAVQDALEQLGAFLDAAGGQHEDPAAVFSTSFRLVGRIHRDQPALSRVLLRQGRRVATADEGLAPRVRRDLVAARDAGRFTFDDVEIAMVLVSGAAIALGEMLHDEPERAEASTVDAVTRSLLLALGLDAADADRLSSAPL